MQKLDLKNTTAANTVGALRRSTRAAGTAALREREGARHYFTSHMLRVLCTFIIVWNRSLLSSVLAYLAPPRSHFAKCSCYSRIGASQCLSAALPSRLQCSELRDQAAAVVLGLRLILTTSGAAIALLQRQETYSLRLQKLAMQQPMRQ